MSDPVDWEAVFELNKNFDVEFYREMKRDEWDMTTRPTTEADILAAIAWAIELHAGQIRKYAGEPYIQHPIRVAYVLTNFGLPREVVAAAVLHDTMEDCGTTFEQIENRFGKTVAGLVLEVTDAAKPSDGNRAARAAINLEHLSRSSYGGASIKLVDISDNVPSVTNGDPKFARVYVPEKLAQLEVLRHGNAALFNRAREILEWATTEMGVGV